MNRCESFIKKAIGDYSYGSVNPWQVTLLKSSNTIKITSSGSNPSFNIILEYRLRDGTFIVKDSIRFVEAKVVSILSDARCCHYIGETCRITNTITGTHVIDLLDFMLHFTKLIEVNIPPSVFGTDPDAPKIIEPLDALVAITASIRENSFRIIKSEITY